MCHQQSLKFKNSPGGPFLFGAGRENDIHSASLQIKTKYESKLSILFLFGVE